MTRSFNPVDLITVPRLRATSALALGAALIAAARGARNLPTSLVDPVERLEKAHGELRTSRQYQRDVRSLGAGAATVADQQLDATWSGLHSFLTGWTKLPSTPEGLEQGRRARAVLERIFPEGLRFLNLPYREQWGESQTRVDRLDEPAIAEHMSALGGGAFVRAIGVAHANYGAALHVTKRKAELAERVNVREPLDKFWGAVRSYALRVSSYLDEHRDDADAQQIGYALLEPLATWKKGSRGGRKARAPEAPGDAGASGDESGGVPDGPVER